MNATSSSHQFTPEQLATLRNKVEQWAFELGFQQIGITDIDLGKHPEYLRSWLDRGLHGSMGYMKEREDLRNNPQDLVPETIRVISARMDYRPQHDNMEAQLDHEENAYISRYALGRDYHKLIRKRLTQLAKKIDAEMGDIQYRAFVDSAPVLERAFAEKAGLGWIGKNTMLINPKAGSWFFLGEIFTNLPLPIDDNFEKFHCGSCTSCLDDCPTNAIIAANQVDARRCISYLTIESKTVVPEEFRKAMGNRIYGCDDCQIVCPWNKFSEVTQEQDFSPRHQLDNISLLELFKWDEKTFLKNTEGSPIRRIGFDKWQSNIAIALGNAPKNSVVLDALQKQKASAQVLTQEAIEWAIEQHQAFYT